MFKKFKPRSFYIEISEKLPDAVSNYEHQVGGHGILNSNKYQILNDGKGTLYKPVQAFPKGEKEILFYKSVFEDSSNDILKGLKQFIPKYIAIYGCSNPTKENLYIGIQDLLYKYKNPAVADVKMGQISYEPNAPPEKQKVEKEKYLHRQEVGFLLTGLKYHDPETTFLDRFHGRSLNATDVYTKGLRKFLGTNCNRAKILAQNFIDELNKLLLWFENQKSYAFIASSLLLIYDHDIGTTTNKDSSLHNQLDHHHNGAVNNDNRVTIKMIDFTHVLSVNELDMNFIYGIKSLINYFQMVLRE